MNCEQARGMMHAILDGSRPEVEITAYRHHLCECDQCRREDQHWHILISEVEALPLWGEPTDLLPTIMNSLSAEAQDKESRIGPVVLFGVFAFLVYHLLGFLKTLSENAGGDTELFHNPVFMYLAWVVVGLAFSAGLIYFLMRKKAHVKFL